MPTAANAINVSTAGAVSFTGSVFQSGTLTVAFGGTGSTSFNANGVVISAGTTTNPLTALTLTNGQLVIGATGAPPIAASLSAGSGISITPGANSITIAATGTTGIVWTDQTGNFTAVAGNGYFLQGTITATLPVSPAEGDTISFIVDSNPPNITTITANTGQVIKVGLIASVSGGTCVNSQRGDSLTLVYRTVGLSWICLSGPQGVWVIT